jgi:hypothetical protein
LDYIMSPLKRITMSSQSISELRQYMSAVFGIEPTVGQMIDISEIVRLAKISNKYSVQEKIAELKREINSRETVYPRIVAKMRLENRRYSVLVCNKKEQDLINQMAILNDIAADYIKLSQIF